MLNLERRASQLIQGCAKVLVNAVTGYVNSDHNQSGDATYRPIKSRWQQQRLERSLQTQCGLCDGLFLHSVSDAGQSSNKCRNYLDTDGVHLLCGCVA